MPNISHYATIVFLHIFLRANRHFLYIVAKTIAHVFHSMPSVADKFNVNSIVLIVYNDRRDYITQMIQFATDIARELKMHFNLLFFLCLFYPLANYSVDHSNEISGS